MSGLPAESGQVNLGASATGGERAKFLESFYDVVHRRRDVRGEFTGDAVDPLVLNRLLEAAHAAPSVGLSQPWDFIVVTDDDTRCQFVDHIYAERQIFADSLDAEQARRFSAIKIDGVLESSVSIIVTYSSERGGPHVLGRHAIADAGLYSTCLAIENLWLACTVEGWGLGWVSFYREEFVSDLLDLPPGVRPVAWLCVGPVAFLQETPDLERHGWRERSPLRSVVHRNRWSPGISLRDSTSPLGGAVRAS
jgi:5,6-dimethylbenzimidazole synthase